jgi:hypothetical protein
MISGGLSALGGILCGRGEDGGAGCDCGDGYNLIVTRTSMS